MLIWLRGFNPSDQTYHKYSKLYVISMLLIFILTTALLSIMCVQNKRTASEYIFRYSMIGHGAFNCINQWTQIYRCPIYTWVHMFIRKHWIPINNIQRLLQCGNRSVDIYAVASPNIPICMRHRCQPTANMPQTRELPGYPTISIAHTSTYAKHMNERGWNLNMHSNACKVIMWVLGGWRIVRLAWLTNRAFVCFSPLAVVGLCWCCGCVCVWGEVAWWRSQSAVLVVSRVYVTHTRSGEWSENLCGLFFVPVNFERI